MAKIPSRKVLAETKHLSREEWLGLRRKGIGGSDAGAVLGMNPWASPYTVWADKLGKLPPKEDNEAMRVGRDLEDYVAQRFTEATGKKVGRRNQIFLHPEHDWMLANIDRQVVGENAGLECKTAKAINLRRWKGQDFPEQYYAQCVHYMAVMGYDRMYLAVLIMGAEFKIYTLERDEEEVEALISAEKDFWESYVQTGEAPPLDGSEPTSDAQEAIYHGGEDGSMTLFDMDDRIKEYFRLKGQEKKLKTEIEQIRQEIQEELGDIEKAQTLDGRYTVTWKSQARESFDAKRFAKDHPDVDMAGYYKRSEYRVFKIKEEKQEA